MVRARAARQNGLALIFVLVMMTIAMSIAIVAARNTLLTEQSARNDRDRQIAFQAAELALNDAELDIMDPNSDRGCKIGTAKLLPSDNCAATADGRGLCGNDASLGNTPLYKAIDWADTNDATRKYVKYGEFTGREATLPVLTSTYKKPRYIIVQTTMPAIVPFDGGKRQFETTSAYRVYALGYGMSDKTQVLLESIVVKPLLSSKCVVGGL